MQSNTIIIRRCAILFFSLFSSVLVSCTGNDDRYAVLDKALLTGCWYRYSNVNFYCQERCYDSTENYYSLSPGGPYDSSYAESFGKYWIDHGNQVAAIYRIYGSLYDRSDSSSNREAMAIVGSKLHFINESGNISTEYYLKSNNGESCGVRWRHFQ